MSNHLAFATITAVLQARISGALSHNGLEGDLEVTPYPVGHDPKPGVYLHLFRVVPSAQGRSFDLPTLRSDASAVQRPCCVVTLHYVISFVGSKNATSYDAERMAGVVLAELHARPTIAPNEVTALLTGPDSPVALAGSDLAAQLDRVRLTMASLDFENTSRLWSLFNQSYHALSVAYEAGPVFLHAQAAEVVSRPAAAVALHVVPVSAPQVAAAVSSAREQPIVAPGESLILRGSGLIGSTTLVRLGGKEIEVSPTSAAEITVPPSDFAGLKSGLMAVMVVHVLDLNDGSPPWRRYSESNSIAIAYAPQIGPDIEIEDIDEGHRLTLAITPVPVAGQDVVLLLDGDEGQLRSSSWSVVADQTLFEVGGLTGDRWLVRVRIDGATSLLSGGGSGGFTGPIVEVN